MRHVRDATLNYSFHNTISTIPATLALRNTTESTPTLLLPPRMDMGPIMTDFSDSLDDGLDFQSSAALDIALSRPLLAGLGISYRLRQASPFTFVDDENTRPPPSADFADGLEETLHTSPSGFGYGNTEMTVFDTRGFYRSDTGGPHSALPGDLCAPEASLDFSASSSLSSVGATQYSFGSADSTHNTSSSHDPMTSCSSFNLQDEPVTYPGDNFGLFPDVNMFDLALSTREPSACVNPLDTMGRMPDSPYYGPPMEGSRTRSPSPSLPANHPPGLPLKEYPLSGVIQDIVSIFAKSEVRESENAVPLVLPPTKRRRTGDRKWIQPSNAATQLPLPTMVPQEFNFPSSPREPPPQAMKDEDGAISFDSAYPSPILNAHHGVPMGELAFRADRYRLRRSVEEIDKAWLMHFAGKLSERGELLQDFRCYVIGCGQTNKRRDHILVHVGAHVDQRPYACSVCSLRFLRKNECTRHEASHSGHRPYSCTLCGQTFVRQDLVTRHLKRTHGIGKENLNHPPRKKAKLQ